MPGPGALMFWASLYAGCIHIIRPEPLTIERVVCNNTALSLSCETGQVVAGEIYAMENTPSCGRPTVTPNTCPCRAEDPRCLKVPPMEKVRINNCRWKQSSCYVRALFSPCLVAKQFHCVPRDKIINICSKETSSLTLSGRSGYITTPNYPTKFPGGLLCILNIQIDHGMVLYIRVLSAHLPPICDEDYLRVTTDRGEDFKICGEINFSMNESRTLHGRSATLSFTSRRVAKTYEGFVLHYEIKEQMRYAHYDTLPTPQHATDPANVVGLSHTLTVTAFLVVMMFI